MKKLITVLLIASISIFASEANNNDVNINKCYGCHGKSFEKKALGKSNVVKDMNRTQIVTALNGYLDGNYSTAGFQGLMKGQLSTYKREDIQKIANQIKAK